MGVTSKIAMGFFGLMVLGAINGSHGSKATPSGGRGLESVVSNYTNTVHDTSCHVARVDFEQLYTGMSYEAAAGTLHCVGREESRSDIAGYSTVMYGWDGSGMIGANMNAMFQNNRLVSKAQFGLR